MLVAALVLAFVAFLALVNFVLTSADWSLYLLFAAAGLGMVLFIIDGFRKRKPDFGDAEEDVGKPSL